MEEQHYGGKLSIRRHFRSYWALYLCLGLVAGVFVTKRSLLTALPDASPYHTRIRSAAAQLRLISGDWVGQDVPVPRVAVKTLKPNVLISRRYSNLQGGDQYTLLLVQCKDARDLVGHYPPSCYPSQGWEQKGTRVEDWDVDGLQVQGKQYQFVSRRLDGEHEIVVDNFMLLPGGFTCRDLNGVAVAAKDFRQRSFGAAQVQIITRMGLSAEKRRDVFANAIRTHRTVIDAILAGEQ
jgi:hypothetical protein